MLNTPVVKFFARLELEQIILFMDRNKTVTLLTAIITINKGIREKNMSLKKTAMALIMVLFVVPVMSLHAADVAKIGVLDLQRVLMTSEQGKAAQADLKQNGTKIEEDFRAREAEIIKLKENIEQEAYVMTRQAREEKEREYRIKLNDLKSLQKKAMMDLKEMENSLVSKIRDELKDIVSDLGKKEGYLMIIDKAVLHYYPNAIDITDQVIQKYNLAKTGKKN